MISEQNLIGWLCMLRAILDGETVISVPKGINEALEARGWIKDSESPDWDGAYITTFTEAGRAVADLNAAEWGIDPCPVEAES